jgi:hypothetical protein
LKESDYPYVLILDFGVSFMWFSITNTPIDWLNIYISKGYAIIRIRRQMSLLMMA